MASRRRGAMVVAATLSALVASCGGPREAPYGLEAVDLLRGSEGIAAVLSAMPKSLQLVSPSVKRSRDRT